MLERVSVRGWDADLFLHQEEAAKPRISRARALLSPFDSLVFERRRLLDLFDMHYRIGIIHTCRKADARLLCVALFLREEIVARVDLKADRAASRLLVRTAFAEPNAPADTATELAAELRLMAQWLELTDVVVEPVGNLADKLAAAIKN
ncbi:DNA glycosylase AlkZ-like family protein [Renibacterium salmoninarum]|uniref:DNA glycosylase AlkZ-like family protein n=1 Tax=Renibacterium salmoninarum TaxID=1646 RepID=UPI002277A94F|nr:crosslink repair DNA glycosylase YcaQ family protein [Renibacterium salmoninarum]